MTVQLRQAAGRTSKADFARQRLKEMAMRIGPGAKLPTVRELRRSLGVANTTLNDALWDLEAHGVVDRKHGSGLYVSPRVAQKNIALVFGSNIFSPGVSPFYGQLIQRCEQRAKSHQENFSFFLDLPSTQADNNRYPVHRDLVEAIQSGKLHGVLLVSRNSTEEEEWLRSQAVPVVSLDTHRSWPETVQADYEMLVRLGVEELAHQGCQRIALILPVPLPDLSSHTFWNANVRAFTEALQHHDLPQRPEWIWRWAWQPADAHMTGEEWGGRAFHDLFASGRSESPDGVVIADDMLTRGMLRAARQSGIVVGRDVKIASHANKGSPALEEYSGELALIEFDPAEMVEAMFGMLERLMNGEAVAEEFTVVRPKRKQINT